MHQDKKRTKGSSLLRSLGAAALLMLPALVFAQTHRRQCPTRATFPGS